MWMRLRLQPRTTTRSKKWALAAILLGLATAVSAAVIPKLFAFFDPTGIIATYNLNGPLDHGNPFFKSLGTNGRSCGTCHIASNAMGISTQNIQERFYSTHGQDPLFAAVDGANCPNGSPGNPADHSLLLGHGLIRIPLTVPVPNPVQFQIVATHDPYGCALVTNSTTGVQTASVFRRPLPTTNLRFLSTIMFDGRETILPLNNGTTFQANLISDLMHQSVDATTGHAQGLPPTVDQQTAIVNFELGLFSAQVFDDRAGLLVTNDAQGGPVNLSQDPYYPGINDTLGQDPNHIAFNPTVFTLFEGFANPTDSRDPFARALAAAQKNIAAGEAIFNTHTFSISNVRGLNDNAALAAALGTTLPIASFEGTCTTCHDTPNVGNHSLPLPLDIGTGHDPTTETDPQIASALAQLAFPDLPVYRITGCSNPFATAQTFGEPYVVNTTDPGKGLITGSCGDVNRIKGPILRGLASRAPYFHNGAAQNLDQLVNFYNQRFQMNLSDDERKQLIAFLNSL
jgi:cytochrome c peroxidase